MYHFFATPVSRGCVVSALWDQRSYNASLLDHAYLRNIPHDIMCYIKDVYFSDHDLILLHIPLAFLVH